MIKKPNEIVQKGQYAVIVYGPPDIGKTTLALSAPDPLLIDADNGLQRVKSIHRKDSVQFSDYSELLKDLADKAQLAPYKSIIIDTGGELLNRMKPWVIHNDPKNAKKDGVTLSQAGYGAVAQEFSRLIAMIRNELKKHIVVVFHAKSESDGDSNKFVLDVEGSTRSNIWKPADLGGYMEIVSSRRYITFGVTERTDGKGNRGVIGRVAIEDLTGSQNDFLTKIFESLDENAKTEREEGRQYEEIIANAKSLISKVTTEEMANEAFEVIKGLSHIYSSKTETWHILKESCKKLGIEFKNGLFVKVETPKVETPKENSLI